MAKYMVISAKLGSIMIAIAGDVASDSRISISAIYTTSRTASMFGKDEIPPAPTFVRTIDELPQVRI